MTVLVGGKCPYEPVADYVILELVPSGTTKIALPDGVMEDMARAKVLAVGPGRHELGHYVDMRAKVGDVFYLLSLERDPEAIELPAPEGRRWFLQRDYYLRLKEAT